MSNYTPVQSEQYPGFYVIPDCDEIVVNEDGNQVVKVGDGSLLKIVFDMDRNKKVWLYTPHPHAYYIRRIVALAFLGPNPSDRRPFVISKDGNKENTHYTNLEWGVPRKRLKEGEVKSDAVSVVARNVETGQMTIFNRISDLAKEHNIIRTTLDNWLKQGSEIVRPTGYQYCISKGDLTFPDPVHPSGGLLRSDAKAVFVKNIVTGEIVEYPSVIQFSNAYDLSYSRAVRWIASAGQKVYPPGILIQKKENFTSWREVFNPARELSIAAARYNGENIIKKKEENKRIFLLNQKEELPIESLENPGQYQVPGMSSISVNEDGTIVLKESVYLQYKQTLGTNGYFYVSTTVDSKAVHLYIHRLVALAFHQIPSNLEEPVVNHKDGNKQNNHYTNLEWTSSSGNTQHAHDTGLVKSAISEPVLIKDILSGQVTEYRSIQATADALKLSFKSLYTSVRAGDQKVFPPGIQAQLKKNLQPWQEVSDLDKVLKDGVYFQKTVAMDTDGKVLGVYDTGSECGRAHGVSQGTVSHFCSQKGGSGSREHHGKRYMKFSDYVEKYKVDPVVGNIA